MIRTISIGPPPDRQLALYDAAREALEAVTAALVPGRPVGEAFDAHATVLDRHGLAAHRLNACGYSLGTTFAPNWMDWPMLYHGNPVLAAPDMVFFLHMIIFDSDAGVAMTLGETVRVTDTTPERLSRSSLDMIRK
jgi:Xaa-Pro dipeptidase